jgi:aspartyl-tRNA(Asn)/glutamyl-tRNA(Gln) amidotransferase subunit A
MARAATIANIAADLASGRVTSRMLVDAALRKIEADGRAYSKVYGDASCAAADAADAWRRRGQPGSVLAGIPMTIKDNMDVKDEVTLAGSKVLKDSPLANADAEVVRRLKVAGAIIIAKTFMPELALSGIGTSRHAAAPPNPLDDQRVPGGSSSGAAVSVAKGVVPATIGSDTGGSVNLPASVCGLVGYKPTAALVPLAGVLPLSRHLDSVGAIGRSVSCCRSVVQVLAQDMTGRAERSLRGLRLAGRRIMSSTISIRASAPLSPMRWPICRRPVPSSPMSRCRNSTAYRTSMPMAASPCPKSMPRSASAGFSPEKPISTRALWCGSGAVRPRAPSTCC